MMIEITDVKMTIKTTTIIITATENMIQEIIIPKTIPKTIIREIIIHGIIKITMLRMKKSINSWQINSI